MNFLAWEYGFQKPTRSNQPSGSNLATQPSGSGSAAGTASSSSTRPKWFYVQEVTEEDQKKLQDYVSNALDDKSEDFQ